MSEEIEFAEDDIVHEEEDPAEEPRPLTQAELSVVDDGVDVAE